MMHQQGHVHANKVMQEMHFGVASCTLHTQSDDNSVTTDTNLRAHAEKPCFRHDCIY